MAKRRITLKNADGTNFLYPKTSASQVEVTSNGTMLDQYLKGMVEELEGDNIVVVKAAKKVSNKLKLKDTSGNTKEFDGSAVVDLSGGVNYAATAGSATNADNAGTLEGSTKEQILNKASEEAGRLAGNAETEAKAYTDTKVASIKPIDPATTGAVGTVRLATQEEVDDGEVIDNIPTGSNPDEPAAVVVTPMALAKKLENYASLDVTGKVPSAQLPSYVDDIIEYANKSAFPATGESSKIYVDLSANKTYRWGGTEYVAILDSLAIGETTGTAYDGKKGKDNADAISALQTRVGIAESGISTINGYITNLKEKDISHDASLQNLDSNKADKTTVTNLQNEVSGIETTANANAEKLRNIIGTGIPDTDYGDSNTTQSVALAVRAIADDDGNQFSTTYAKNTDIPDTSGFALKTELINLTYSDDGEVTY